MERTTGDGKIHKRTNTRIAVKIRPRARRIGHRMFRVRYEVHGRFAYNARVHRSKMRLHHSHGNILDTVEYKLYK